MGYIYKTKQIIHFIHFICTLMSFILLIGCVSWPPRSISSSYYLSEYFDENIDNEIIVVNVIDARPNHEIEFKDIKGYQKRFTQHILNLLSEKKNYSLKILDIDTSSCSSIELMQDLNCISDLTILDDNIDQILLLSIDDYTPPKVLVSAPKSKVSGGLYSKKLRSFLWKDTRIDTSGDRNEAIIPGAPIINDIRNVTVSGDIVSRDFVIIQMEIMLWDFPPFIEGNKYEEQIKALRRRDW